MKFILIWHWNSIREPLVVEWGLALKATLTVLDRIISALPKLWFFDMFLRMSNWFPEAILIFVIYVILESKKALTLFDMGFFWTVSLGGGGEAGWEV